MYLSQLAVKKESSSLYSKLRYAITNLIISAFRLDGKYTDRGGDLSTYL